MSIQPKKRITNCTKWDSSQNQNGAELVRQIDACWPFQNQHVFDALRDLPQNAVVDGEVVALVDAGRPNFNFLQHSRSQAKRICYFVFDLLVYDNRDLMQLPLVERREILKSKIKFQSPRVRIADYFETTAETMLRSAREQGLEGVVAKRKDSRYEAGKRSDHGRNSGSTQGRS